MRSLSQMFPNDIKSSRSVHIICDKYPVTLPKTQLEVFNGLLKNSSLYQHKHDFKNPINSLKIYGFGQNTVGEVPTDPGLLLQTWQENICTSLIKQLVLLLEMS